jgi:hypothetical protein
VKLTQWGLLRSGRNYSGCCLCHIFWAMLARRLQQAVQQRAMRSLSPDDLLHLVPARSLCHQGGLVEALNCSLGVWARHGSRRSISVTIHGGLAYRPMNMSGFTHRRLCSTAEFRA